MATYLTNSKVQLYTLWQVPSNFFSDKACEEYDKACEEYANWIYKPSKETDPVGVRYGEAYIKYSPEETIDQFSKIVHMVPCDILRYVRFQLREF